MGEGHLLGRRYRLDAVVGRGGMGTVWRAYDVMLDREVAVKEVVLPPGLSLSERDVLYERTFREARASARLSHPGVVTVHDVVEEGGRPWIVMELVRARSLQDLIEQAPLPPRHAAEIGLQMLAALRHAHEKGILHRDVKPSNVLITDAGRVVLTDFGIAQVEGDATLTQTGLVMGSPAYIPPERAQGERAVPASDLWALGATLYAAVEGRSPYERSDAMSSLAAALSEPVPPPRNAGALSRVLEGLLAREPRHRMTGPQALPLLTEVATMPAEAPRTTTDATVMDEPSRRGPVQPDPAAETVLDPAGFEAATREDSGSGGRPASSWQPPQHHQQQDRRPQDRAQRDRQPPGGQPPPSRQQGHRPADHQPENHQQHDHQPRDHQPRDRPPRHPAPEPEARTLLETDWSPPPAEHGDRSPWEAQPSKWSQPLDPSAVRRAQRTRTIVIVTIAVIVVVVAVLTGAFILRQKLSTSSLPGPAVVRYDDRSAALGAGLRP
ncbi:serine/threonine-protein kinase [Spirillospora sp. NPDC047279]|uniref:serine/threonine-protein kinase n=1 Tax=Spirillospora sp. NPDC047279 TaxID=3155478 RepID=UPI00340F9C0A